MAIGPEDVTERLTQLAFGRVNDCVRLVMEDGCDIGGLDLTLLAEVRRTEKGAVEIKLVDRMKALELLAAQVGGERGEEQSLLAAMQAAAVECAEECI